MLDHDDPDIRRAEEILGITDGLFPRGFIFSHEPLEVSSRLPHYKTIQTPKGYLYGDTGRIAVQEASRAGNTLLILGRIVSLLDAEPADQADYLLNQYLDSEQAFHEALDWCGGRFAIIIFASEEIRFYHDFLATRSIYFHRTEGLVASHFGLLEPYAEQLTEHAGHMSGPSFYRWWDASSHVEVSSLLSDHLLLSRSDSVDVRRYWPRGANVHVGRDIADLVMEISLLWQRSLSRLAKSTDVALSLTGGQDSRLMLTLALPAVENLKCFTYMPNQERLNTDTFWASTYKRDHEIVREVVDKLDLDHDFLTDTVEAHRATDLKPLLGNNRLGNSHGYWVVRTMLSNYQPDQYVHIRGNFLEAVRAQVVVDQTESELTSLLGIINHHQKKAFGGYNKMTAVERERASMEKLDEFGYFDFHPSWEKSTMFYCEARTSQWHGEMLNEQDVIYDTFLPHNNRRIMELFWATDVRDRRDGLVVMDLVNHTVPLLNFFPINGEDNLYDQWRKAFVEGSERTKLIDDWLPEIGDRELLASYPVDKVFVKGGLGRKSFTLNDGGFHLPATGFVESAVVDTGDFVVPAHANVLEVVVRLPYSNKAGAGRMSLEMEVNGQVYESMDPALSPLMTLVRITNLSAGDRVRFVLSSTIQRESTSWRKATNTQVSRLNFLRESVPESPASRLRPGNRVKAQPMFELSALKQPSAKFRPQR